MQHPKQYTVVQSCLCAQLAAAVDGHGDSIKFRHHDPLDPSNILRLLQRMYMLLQCRPHLCACEVPVEVLLGLQVPHLTLQHTAATVGQHGCRQALTRHLTPAAQQQRMGKQSYTAVVMPLRSTNCSCWAVTGLFAQSCSCNAIAHAPSAYDHG